MNWLIMSALMLVSGVISGAETAVFSLRPSERRRLMVDVPLGARLLERPTDLLVALLLANLLINVAYFTVSSSISMALHEQGRSVAAFTVAAGSLVALVIAGEILPKSVALLAPARIAAWIAAPVVVMRLLLSPVVALASGATRVLETLLLGSPTRHDEPDANDYKSALSSGVALGAYRAVELALLHDVVDIGVRRARSLMVPRVDVVYLELSDSRERWIEIMATHPFTDYPVVDGSADDVLGTVNTAVLLANPERRRQDLLDPPLFAPVGMAAERLVLRLLSEGAHLAILLDEYGGVEGVLGLRDLSRAVLGEVGGLASTAFPRRPGGGVLLPGSSSLEMLRDEMGLELVSRRADTLGGALAEALGRVPRRGDELRVGTWRLRVTAMAGARVASVLARPATPATRNAEAAT